MSERYCALAGRQLALAGAVFEPALARVAGDFGFIVGGFDLFIRGSRAWLMAFAFR